MKILYDKAYQLTNVVQNDAHCTVQSIQFGCGWVLQHAVFYILAYMHYAFKYVSFYLFALYVCHVVHKCTLDATKYGHFDCTAMAHIK